MTPQPKRWLAAILGLSLAAVTVAAPLPKKKDPQKAAQDAIVYLSERLDSPKVEELAKQIVREHESDNISSIFMLKSRGGLGTGYAPLAQRDGIEVLIQTLARRAQTKENLEKARAELVRTARIMQAMAELAPHRLALFPRTAGGQHAKEAREVSTEFEAATAEFREAVVEGDPTRVRTAATKLNNSCCHCHSVARD